MKLLVIWLPWFRCWLAFKLFWGLVLGNKQGFRSAHPASCLLLTMVFILAVLVGMSWYLIVPGLFLN